MLLSTQTEVLGPAVGEEETLRMLAKAGFDAVDFSFFRMENEDDIWNQDGWREHALSLRRLMDELGLVCNQAHAPFPSSSEDDAYTDKVFGQILRSMEAASILGARNIVVHPKTHLAPYPKKKQELHELSVEMYKRLMPYCEKWNITVCTENMWGRDFNRRIITGNVNSTPEEFIAMLEEVNHPRFKVCLDIGHCAIVGLDPAEAIRALGKDRIVALHVHDVDYVNDNHTLPYVLKLNWDEITRALADIGYEGDLTFEADMFIRGFPRELWQDAVDFMVKIGRNLISKVAAAG